MRLPAGSELSSSRFLFDTDTCYEVLTRQSPRFAIRRSFGSRYRVSFQVDLGKRLLRMPHTLERLHIGTGTPLSIWVVTTLIMIRRKVKRRDRTLENKCNQHAIAARRSGILSLDEMFATTLTCERTLISLVCVHSRVVREPLYSMHYPCLSTACRYNILTKAQVRTSQPSRLVVHTWGCLQNVIPGWFCIIDFCGWPSRNAWSMCQAVSNPAFLAMWGNRRDRIDISRYIVVTYGHSYAINYTSTDLLEAFTIWRAMNSARCWRQTGVCTHYIPNWQLNSPTLLVEHDTLIWAY